MIFSLFAGVFFNTAPVPPVPWTLSGCGAVGHGWAPHRWAFVACLRLMEIRWEVFFGVFFGVANGNWGFFGADFFFGVKGKPPATGD